MKKVFLSTLLVVFSLVSVRCGTEIGNSRSTGFEIVGVQGSSPKLATRAATSGATLTDARIVLQDFKFRPLSACQSSSSEGSDVLFSGPYVVNLLTNESIPDIGSAVIPAGTYCRVELKMAKLDPDKIPTGVSASDPIVNQSFYVEGTRGDGKTFIAKLERNEEFKLENTLGFEISSTSSQALIMAFYLSDWFAGIDLDTADVTGDTIYIDKDNNKDLLDILKTNIETSAQLFEDSNGNGSLDTNEQDPEDKLASGSN